MIFLLLVLVILTSIIKQMIAFFLWQCPKFSFANIYFQTSACGSEILNFAHYSFFSLRCQHVFSFTLTAHIFKPDIFCKVFVIVNYMDQIPPRKKKTKKSKRCLCKISYQQSVEIYYSEKPVFPSILLVNERMRGSHRYPQGSESQTKQKSVSRLGIEPRSSDLRSDALPIKLSRPTPGPHHSTSFSSHCGQRRHCYLRLQRYKLGMATRPRYSRNTFSVRRRVGFLSLILPS